MKKNVVLCAFITLLAVTAMSFSGCDITGGGKNESGDTGDMPSYDFKGNTTVKVAGTVSDELKQYTREKYGLTVENTIFPWADFTVRLATLVLSGDSPDVAMFRSDGIDFPNYIVNNLVQPVNDYIDLSHPFYTDVKDYYEKTKWQDKNYLMVMGMGTSSSMFYNKKLFTDAGLETPWELYKKNEWDWNKLREYALEMTEDSNNDGIPNRYGFAMCRPHGLLYTTGKSLGDFDSKTLTVNNRTMDPGFARAMNFLSTLITKDYVTPTSITDTLEYFATDAVAMVYAQLFYEDPNVVKLAQDGKLGICPLPRDPETDKYYARGEMGSYWLVDGAKNPKGGVAFYNCAKAYGSDTTKLEEYYNSFKTKYSYSDENIEQMKANADISQTVPVMELTPWLAGGADWNMILNGSTWDVELAKAKPAIDAQIKEIFKPLEVDIPESPKLVDSFENYGDNTAKVLENYVISSEGSSNLKITLDSANAQAGGKYAAKIVYDCSDVSWGGLEMAINKTWEKNDAIRFYAKGDGKEQTIIIQFTTLTGVWSKEIKITGTEGRQIKLPFNEFALPEGQTGTLNLSNVTKFSLFFDDKSTGEKTLYIDQIEAYKQ